MNCSGIAVTFHRMHLRRTCAVRSRDRLALVIADLFIYHLLCRAARRRNLQIAATASYTHMTLVLLILLLCLGNPSSVSRDESIL